MLSSRPRAAIPASLVRALPHRVSEPSECEKQQCCDSRQEDRAYPDSYARYYRIIVIHCRVLYHSPRVLARVRRSFASRYYIGRSPRSKSCEIERAQ